MKKKKIKLVRVCCKGSNGVRTHSNLARKRTLAQLVKLEFLDIQATIESRFTLKPVRDMIITYSLM